MWVYPQITQYSPTQYGGDHRPLWYSSMLLKVLPSMLKREKEEVHVVCVVCVCVEGEVGSGENMKIVVCFNLSPGIKLS